MANLPWKHEHLITPIESAFLSLQRSEKHHQTFKHRLEVCIVLWKGLIPILTPKQLLYNIIFPVEVVRPEYSSFKQPLYLYHPHCVPLAWATRKKSCIISLPLTCHRLRRTLVKWCFFSCPYLSPQSSAITDNSPCIQTISYLWFFQLLNLQVPN